MFRFDDSDLMQGLNELEMRTEAAVQELADRSAKRMEDFAKTNAPWTDRTGEARRTLEGSTSKIENGIRITLSHGVDYGQYLELAMEKRYAIIMRTIREIGSKEVLPAFNRLLRK